MGFGTTSTANYLSESSVSVIAKTRVSNVRQHRGFKTFITAFLALTFIFSLALSNLGSTAAFADDDDDRETIGNSVSDCGSTDGDDGFQSTLDGCKNTDDENSFGRVINRLFTITYLNETANASVPDGYNGPPYGDGNYNCSTNAANAGRATYHNCDVPNIVTEFVQDVVAIFKPSGVQNAGKDVVTVENEWFGLPSNIPNNSDVPVDADQRNAKYTGLEIYGYGLKYTAYVGEWDHIKVLTSARTLSNFTFMDNLKLGVKAIFEGVVGGVEAGVGNFMDAISKGDIFGAIGGFFSGLLGGGSSAAINVIIDTSDLNVFNTNAWYRVGYGPTLYGARELSQGELSEHIGRLIVKALTSGEVDSIPIPEDLAGLEDGPPRPKEIISKCTIKNSDGEMVAWGNVSESPGPTEAECDDAAEAENSEDPVSQWDEDGTQKEESLADWKETNSDWFDTAKKYEINCDVDTGSGAVRKDEITGFYSCIPGQIQSAGQEYRADELNAIADQISNDTNDFVLKSVIEAIASDPKNNYNAPWVRFVCVDESTGLDMLDKDGYPLPVFNTDGSYSGNCGEIRAPIQNGFFGNGYTPGAYDGSGPAPVDTRYERLDTSIVSIIFPVDLLTTQVSNFGLNVSVFMTRAMNTVVNLMFSPLLETFGFDEIVVSLIEDFRTSIFFPFAVFVIAMAGLYIFTQAARSKQYAMQFKSILMLLLTFMTGAIMMFKPALVVNLVDDVPSRVETAVMGTIFGYGNEANDELCTATGTASSAEDQDLEGNPLASPKDATRTMMCEVWRVFAFNPWVYGQWGTNMQDLYAAGSGEANVMKNTNGDLVGDASVNMGNNTNVKNWAIYQLEQTASGTGTTRDYTDPAGRVDSDYYRIVDMQAGPNNGAGTDSRYFSAWSGNEFGPRLVAGWGSAPVSILGLIVILLYGFTKIQITFVMLIMLLLLPFVFLIGLFPNAGRLKLKQYFATIGGLMLQRIMLVTLIALMLRILSGMANSSDNYFGVMIGTIVVLLAFLSFRKQILKLIMESMTMGMGTFGGKYVDNPREGLRDAAPNSIKNTMNLAGRAASSAAAGAVGGFVVGGISGARKAAAENSSTERRKMFTSQRRQGFGIGQSMFQAGKASRDENVSDLRQRVSNNQGFKRDLNSQYEESLEKRGLETEIVKDDGKVEKRVHRYTTSQGINEDLPNRDLRRLSKLERTHGDHQQAQHERLSESAPIRKSADIDSIQYNAKISKELGVSHTQNRADTLSKKYEKLIQETGEMEARRDNAKQKNAEFRDSLSDMRNNFFKKSTARIENVTEDVEAETKEVDRTIDDK